MAAKAAEKNTETMLGIEIPEIEKAILNVEIIGDSPLIVHKWSEKAKKEMLDKQMKKATKGKEAKDPWMDFCESLYWLDEMPKKPTQKDIDNGRFGFPAIAFKAAAVNAAYQQGLVSKKTTIRGAFHIDCELIEIIGKPTMREDMVKIGGMSKVADIRYRGAFEEWSAILPITYNPVVITPEQIVSFINMAGFSCGVGEWRPERDGLFGRFSVKKN